MKNTRYRQKIHNSQCRPTVCFDDVLLRQQLSDLKSRKEVDLSQELDLPNSDDKKIKISLPVIAAPMDTVYDFSLYKEMWEVFGALSIVPRNDRVDAKREIELINSRLPSSPTCVSVSFNTFDNLEELEAICGNAQIICLDVANGFNTHVGNKISLLKDLYPNAIIMAGNVTDKEGFEFLVECGADAVRMGVGSGSICSTRLKTGTGMPVLTSVLLAADSGYARCNGGKALIVADGGHRVEGDIAKSLAAGADLVMLGSILAGHRESPGQDIFVGDKRYRIYRGMASHQATGSKRHIEGIQSLIPFKGEVRTTLQSIQDSLASALSYSGCRTLEEFRDAAQFIYHTTNTVAENDTHIKTIGV